MEAAINHYIEAGQSIKAMEAAINSKQVIKYIQKIFNYDDRKKK